MGYKFLILGDSGTGKSASLRNFDPDDIMIINCAGKPLPFRNTFETRTPQYHSLIDDILMAIYDFMKQNEKKTLIIDDAQYIMSFQYIRRIKETGWEKWNDIQGDFFDVIQTCDDMPDDRTVYFLSHIERDNSGREKIKTMGKMLDEKITVEGLFTTVLKTAVQDGHYYFLTQNSGMDTVKSPMGLFGSYAIDNDLAFVDKLIRNYYGIGEDIPSDSEVKELSVIAEHPEVEKPEVEKSAGGRRRKSRRKTGTNMPHVEETVETATNEPDGAETRLEEKPKRKPRRRKNIEETEETETN